MKYILGTKQQMTQIFNEEGMVIPATIISVPEATITQLKTQEKDGSSAVQIASGDRKAQIGHFAGKGNFRHVCEFKTSTEGLNEGDKISVDSFEIGDTVTVTGVSKGKGFQGVVKRHGFGGAPTSHGHRHDTRRPGSIGATGPQRVFKGTRMAGRTGSDRVSVKNLKVVAVDAKNQQLLVKGAVPGRRGTLLEIVTQ
jgi:large subunit ribosomal protein L3